MAFLYEEKLEKLRKDRKKIMNALNAHMLKLKEYQQEYMNADTVIINLQVVHIIQQSRGRINGSI